MKTRLFSRGQMARVVSWSSITVLALSLFAPLSANAAQITARKLTLGSSQPSAATTYAFNFTVPSATVIKGVQFTVCNAPSGACVIPTGFSNTGVTLTGQPTNLGAASGWTVDNGTAGILALNNASNATAPTGAQTVSFTGVTNPSTAAGQVFYVRIVTYTAAAYTGAIDSGNVSAATAQQITVTASVDEVLTFCVYTGASCGSGSGTVALGTLTTSTTGTGTNKMDVGTNANSGYSVIYTGTTLTSGANTIAAMGTQSANGSATASSQGSGQFGLNLRANTTPNIGTDVSGSGTGAYGTNYGTANNFRFFTGDTVATDAVATNNNTFTVSYIANIPSIQQAGAYQTILTYICTATF